jgi:gliding motility-associated-like protein
VTGVDGLTPYEYSIDAGVTFQPSGTFSSLVAGPYTVIVRDALLSTVNVPVTITQPAAALTVTTTQIDVLCNGGSTGSATATGAGGTSPYSYSWNTTPVQTTQTATGLKAGTYTVTATDANLCTAITNVIITELSALTVATTQTNVNCNGGSDGTATAVPAGGTGPYSYSWNTTPVQTTITATGLIVGTYTVAVKDANGCTTPEDVTITGPAVLSLSASTTNAGCPASNDGEISLEITGGTAPYHLLWPDGDSAQIRSDLLPGTYTILVTDANGCAESTSAEVEYTVSYGCLEIPEIITPDPADGHNDTWVIKNIDIYPNAEIKIYSRWGKLIYHTKNPLAEPWDGRYANGRFVPTDSYHYILDLHDGSKQRSGVISVVR